MRRWSKHSSSRKEVVAEARKSNAFQTEEEVRRAYPVVLPVTIYPTSPTSEFIAKSPRSKLPKSSSWATAR